MDCMNKEKKIILMGLKKTCFTLITNRNYDGIDFMVVACFNFNFKTLDSILNTAKNLAWGHLPAFEALRSWKQEDHL